MKTQGNPCGLPATNHLKSGVPRVPNVPRAPQKKPADAGFRVEWGGYQLRPTAVQAAATAVDSGEPAPYRSLAALIVALRALA